MLQISVPITPELFNEETEEFIDPVYKTLELEHSLLSLSKWESKWHKAFLGKKEKTDEELLDYIKCMTITADVDPSVYYKLTADNYVAINNYIEDPMTATCIPNFGNQGKPSNETITSELIYYWMICANIPFKCETWHLNKLLALIKVCSFKNNPRKKINRRDVMNRNRALNEQRKKELNTRG